MFDVLYAVLFMGTPGVALIFVVIMGYLKLLEEMKKLEGQRNFSADLIPLNERYKTIVTILSTSLIFAFALWFLILGTEHNRDIIIAMGFNIGITGFFTVIGQGLIMRVAIVDIVRNPMLFGKSITLMVLSELVVMMSFCVVFWTIGSDEPSGDLLIANYTMGICSIGALISGKSIADMGIIGENEEQFPKYMLKGVPGLVVALIGFGIATFFIYF